MSDSAYLTYYQRNRDIILNRAKDYYGNDKERLKRRARDKYSNLFEEENTKRENMGRIDTAICLKKRKKIKIISQKLSRDKKVSI